MGFSLKRAATAIGTGGISEVLRAADGLTKANSPGLPAVPTPNLYDEVPDFTPEEIAYIQKRRQTLDQYDQRLNAAPTAYDQSNDEIAALENANYKAALEAQQGQLSVQQRQARQVEFQRLLQAAGRRGIRILGDDPSTATSNSTAGIQLLSEFNKRYDELADQQRLSERNFGMIANNNRLGLINQAKQNYFGNNLALEDAYTGVQGVYGDQRAAQYNRNIANTDTRNQFLTNTYNSAVNQATLNANAKNQTQSNRLGLVNSIIGGGATLLTGGASAARGAAGARKPASTVYAGDPASSYTIG